MFHFVSQAIVGTCVSNSSEYFSIADPLIVRDKLGGFGIDDCKIIFVLRRQDRIIESAYNQEVKGMGVEEPIGNACYDKSRDYYRLASSWAEAFQHENVHLFLYEDLTSTPRWMIHQIFEHLDSELAVFGMKNGGLRERLNPSLPASLLEFKRLANKAGAHQVLSFLESAHERGTWGPPFRMEPREAKQHLHLYRESNGKVAREFFNRDGDLFDESDLDGEQIGADYTGHLPIETLAMLFALYIQDQAKSQKQLVVAIRRLVDTLSKIQK
jgi:hypothetical protein